MFESARETVTGRLFRYVAAGGKTRARARSKFPHKLGKFETRCNSRFQLRGIHDRLVFSSIDQ